MPYPTLPQIEHALAARQETVDLATAYLAQPPEPYLQILLDAVHLSTQLSDSDLLAHAPEASQILAEALHAHCILELSHYLTYLRRQSNNPTLGLRYTR